MHYVYVDPVSGSDTPTGARKNSTAATAAAVPYQTLTAALTQEQTNMTTLADSVTFRLLGGTEVLTTGYEITDANWPDTTDAFRIILQGYGTGVHDGTFSRTNGYSFVRTTSGTGILLTTSDDVYITLNDFRIDEALGNTRAFSKTSYSGLTMNRMLVGAQLEAARFDGGDSDARRLFATNCVFLSRTEEGARFISGNNNYAYVDHCTIVGSHATTPALNCTGAGIIRVRYCYIGNTGAGVAAGGTGWASATTARNATDDTTGTSGLHNIACATASGAYFINLTSGAENFYLGVASALIDEATGSSEAADIIGTTRTTPDVGAFEFSATPAVISLPTPTGTLSTRTRVDIGCTTDIASGGLYVVVDTVANISGITAAQVIAGDNANDDPAVAATDVSISDTTPNTGLFGALTKNVTYGYAIAQDNGAESNVLTGTFTTSNNADTYATAFAGMSVGSPPTGWTFQNLGTGNANIVSGPYMRITPQSGARHCLALLDAIGNDGDSDLVEIVAKVRFGTGLQGFYQGATVVGRVGSVGDNRPGYGGGLHSGGYASSYGVIGSGLLATNMTELTSGSATLTPISGVWYWMLFRLNGTSVKAWYWTDGDTPKDNGDTADLSATNSTYTLPGGGGVRWDVGDGRYMEVGFFGVGFNGEAAPLSTGGGGSSAGPILQLRRMNAANN